MLIENAAFEKHYRIGDLARTRGLGREAVRKLVKDDPGVIKIRMGRKKSHTVLAPKTRVSAGPCCDGPIRGRAIYEYRWSNKTDAQTRSPVSTITINTNASDYLRTCPGTQVYFAVSQ